ncbi:hypothetical protein [Spirillospora sp. CA-294931]|uniref:hypothetical protein n=1 Tax=Spirillospora sp. CA-294931 TaxID=3240042 RepID=UPI003D8C2B72
MRCPNCGSDTTPALPRCTRCNAPLSGGDEATTPAPPPWEGSTRPWGDSTVPEPPRSDPAHWKSPPPGETSIPLSQAPWEEEPEIWRPPPPRRKSPLPLLLIVGGVVLLGAVALGIIFWPDGDGKDGEKAAAPQSSAASDPSAAQSEPVEETSASESPDQKRQATAVDGLLSEMATTRSALGTAVEADCGTSDMEGIRDARQSQLSKAKALEVGALDRGEELKSALVRALEASLEANKRYVAESPGCPAPSSVEDINGQASQAKSEFLGIWRDIAAETGLPTRNESNI